MTEPDIAIHMTKKDDKIKYAVVIYLNPVIMACLTNQQQMDFDELQKKAQLFMDEMLETGKETQEYSDKLKNYFGEIKGYIDLAEKQYREIAQDPQQVLNDIILCINNFTTNDFRQMRLVDEWEYKYIKEALIGINHPLIEYYKELTDDKDEIPKDILVVIQAKSTLIDGDLKRALQELKSKTADKEKNLPVLPRSQLTRSRYFLLSTDRGINAAFRLDTSKNNLGTILPSNTDDLIYQSPTVTLTIVDFYKQLDPLHFSTAAKMVLATVLLTYQQQKQKQLTLKYADYMDWRGLNDRKAAREQLKAQLDLLWHTSLTYDDIDYIPKTDKKGKKYTSKRKVTRKIRLIQQLDFGRGYVTITLGDTLHNRLQQIDDQNFLAPYPVNLLKLSTLEDYAFSMGDYFARLEREQATQDNYHKHAVETILEQCEFPKAEQLIANGERHLSREITERFEKALQRLIDIGYLTDYTYKERNGNKANYSRLMVDYEYFITLNVCIDTTSPDNTHFKECKSKRTKKK